MIGWIVPLIIIGAVIGVAYYRKNKSGTDKIIDKAESVEKSIANDVKKL